MNNLHTAFSAPPATSSLLSLKSTTSRCIRSSFTSRTITLSSHPTRRVFTPCMTATEPGTEPEKETTTAASTDETPTQSASEILRTMREEAAADDTPVEKGMLGIYRDVDGRSNVWAVEPTEETDTRPQLSKITLIVAAAAFIGIALLVLPLLPFTNPDQL